MLNIFSRSAGPQAIPSQTYDYAALDAFALSPQPDPQESEESGEGSQGNVDERQANVADEDEMSNESDSGEALDDEDGSTNDAKNNTSSTHEI